MLERKFHMRKSIPGDSYQKHAWIYGLEGDFKSRCLVSSSNAMAQKELRFTFEFPRADLLPLRSLLVI